MITDDEQDPEQELPESEIEMPEDPGEAGADDEVEAHAEQEVGEDKPWCIGCAD